MCCCMELSSVVLGSILRLPSLPNGGLKKTKFYVTMGAFMKARNSVSLLRSSSHDFEMQRVSRKF